jgi:signal transduction histidine kinase
MIKSLYVRVVVTFLAAVLLGLVSAFFITINLYRDQIAGEVEDELFANAREIAAMYSHLNGPQADDYLKSAGALIHYHIRLFDRQGTVKEYGIPDGSTLTPISKQAVESVLNGGMYSSRPGSPNKLVVGIPFAKGGEKYALLVQSSGNKLDSLIRRVLLVTQGIVLLVGSIIIFIAARYLVKPLQAMTAATRRMSKGDFNFEWKWPRRKDELGELAQSFGEMAAELKQMEQMRQDFVSNVSHEIQSPLTSISGFSKALRQKQLPEEERNRYLDIIQTESERMSRLSENLLKLASLESEHHPFHPRTYDLDEQLRHMIVACEPQWSAKRIEFDLKLPNIKICADEDQLSQVWLNLLSNSIKYSPDRGTIRLELRQTTSEIVVTVMDEGIGISKEDQERIFERFFKADRSRTRAKDGNGLGLAIAGKIVRLHRGTIKVKSAPGEGAVFTVTLPSIPYNSAIH